MIKQCLSKFISALSILPLAENFVLNLSHTATANVDKQFSSLSFEQNKNIITQSANENKSRIDIAPAAINAAAEYFRKVVCKS